MEEMKQYGCSIVAYEYPSMAHALSILSPVPVAYIFAYFLPQGLQNLG